MVQLPNGQELKQLKNFNQPFCLTIYLPHIETDPSGATNPNKIEFKNLLRQAETALLDSGAKPADTKKTLRPARELLGSDKLWPLRRESLALFMHPKFFRRYYLPDGVPHMLTIERGFNLEPLENAMRNNQAYLVLALSHKNVRMFEGDRFNIRRLKLKNFPDNMEESLNIDEYPKAAEARNAAPADGGRSSETFHSEYNENQTDKRMLLQFFRMLDHRLRKFLQTKDKPLIIAGVNYLLPIYRQVNTSPYLVPGGLTGNFEHENPDRIRERAWTLLKENGWTA